MNINIETFFTDHWREIEDERVARYEQMFVWREGQRALLAPAEIELGQRVLDVGCGPGFFAIAIADMVGASGSVDGVDINARFVADANERAAALDNVRFHEVQDHVLPFDDESFDRVICKNVLEYVPDLPAVLTECRRVLKSGGRIHIIDSDWGFVVVEPWNKATVDAFFQAAAPAFNEPYIGRRAPGLLAGVGFTGVGVKLSAFVDREGTGLNVLTNMASYIRAFGTLPEDRVARLLQDCRDGVENGTYLFCLPQFLVTASK